MSSLVTTAPQSAASPYGIYGGPRVGDEFLEWNIGQIKARIARELNSTALARRRDRNTLPRQQARPGTGNGALAVTTTVDSSMGQLGLPSLLKSIAGEAVTAIELNTQLTGPIIVQKPFADSANRPPAQVEGSSFAKSLLPFLKPAMYAYTPAGKLVVYQPYGAPEDYSTMIGLTLGGAMVVAAGVGMWLGKRALCGSRKNPRKVAKSTKKRR